VDALLDKPAADPENDRSAENAERASPRFYGGKPLAEVVERLGFHGSPI
jgi:hypothetical protein